jgi:peptide/nickel transport system substrate-binding protein
MDMETIERQGHRLGIGLLLGAVATLGASGSDEGARVSGDPFCQQVIPAVEAFMAQAAAANPTPEDSRYGGTVVVGGINEPSGGMNSSQVGDIIAGQHHQFVNLMTLLDYDENLQPRPYLAESWDIAEDNTAMTFHIRQDVLWHDGEVTDAHDVAFTYEAVTNPDTGYPNAAFWDHYVKGPEGVEVLDDFTVRISMRPHGQFLDPFRALGILPEHLLGDVPATELGEHPYGTQCPVGNGPFVFSSHAPLDRWVFDANPAFPAALGGRPFVDRYVYRMIPEQTTLLTECLTGGIDVFYKAPPDQAQRIIDDPRVELRRYPSRTVAFVVWNGRRPQLSDVRVRRAITMATDRAAIVDALLQGYGTVANTGVPPFHFAFDREGTGSIENDPAGAEALLDQAGWSDRDGDGVRENAAGEPLSFSLKVNTGNQLRQNIVEIMQAQLADIGIDARVEVVETTTLFDQLLDPEERDFDGAIVGWSVDFRLDETDLFHSDRIDQPFAWSGTQNPEIDRYLDLLGATVDEEEAAALWREYQQAIVEEQPYTFLYFLDQLMGVSGRVQGAEMDARGEWLNLREWYLDPESR